MIDTSKILQNKAAGATSQKDYWIGFDNGVAYMREQVIQMLHQLEGQAEHRRAWKNAANRIEHEGLTSEQITERDI